MAYVDAGPSDGQVALLQHGEPSWSFLYRHVVWVLTENGIRCVAPDMVGFGRSDKPLHQADYSYTQLVEWTRERVFDHLDLREVTLVGQDWGGLIGLRLLAEHPDRFNRVVAANTGLPTGDFDMPEVCAKAGVRAMPGLVPTRPDDPASEANRAAWEALAASDLPFLLAFSDSDLITGAMAPILRKLLPGTRALSQPTIRNAGHFLQEDAGDDLGRVVVDFMSR